MYVHEGIERESPKSKRHRLINPYYFCRVCSGKENEQFWDEIYEYISNHYDLSRVKKIYINGDGADWIRTGAGMHAKAHFVLDRFHMHKYIISATSHLKDSAQDARNEIYKAINGKRKWAAEEAFDKIYERNESCCKCDFTK